MLYTVCDLLQKRTEYITIFLSIVGKGQFLSKSLRYLIGHRYLALCRLSIESRHSLTQNVQTFFASKTQWYITTDLPTPSHPKLLNHEDISHTLLIIMIEAAINISCIFMRI